MSVSTIWVYTDLTQPEEGHGEPTSTTLELLAKASELADTVVAVVGGSGDRLAPPWAPTAPPRCWRPAT
jgi:hypothetical protein